MGRRHQSKLSKLNRSTKERASLFKIQLNQLIQNGSLTTTVVKAKVIKRLFDRLASKATENTLTRRRGVIASLSNAKNAHKLFDQIIPLMGDRKSGFTTIQKVGSRKGDNTDTATLSLIVPLPVTPEKVEKK